MANSIALAEKYAQKLDEKLRVQSLTGALEINADLVKDFDGAGTVKIMKIDTGGLGTYNRATGYPAGDLTATWESFTIDNDRGREFSVDSQDENEAARMSSFMSVTKEFVEVGVIPEVDSVRFAGLATEAGTSVSGTIADGNAFLTAIDTAVETLQDNEAILEGATLFISTAGFNQLKNADKLTRNINVEANSGNVNRGVWMLDGMDVVVVPKSRFNDAITLGTNGYTQTGSAINFIIVPRNTAQAITKHVKVKEFSPEVNQTADAWKYQYRIYHDIVIPDNKKTAIYAHTVA
jgi:hypothetical protein